MLINVAGNIIYAFAFYKESTNYIIWGRLIAGIGSGCVYGGCQPRAHVRTPLPSRAGTDRNLALCMHYVTQSTSLEERSAAIGVLRMAQTAARFIGPNIGFAFLDLEEPNFDGSTIVRLFNFYSVPGWIAATVSLFAAIAVAVGLDSSTTLGLKDRPSLLGSDGLSVNAPAAGAGADAGGQYAQLAATDAEAVAVVPTPKQPPGKTLMAVCALANLVVSTASWSVCSQLTALAMGEFHLVTQQSELWEVFVAMGVGSLVGVR